MLESSRDARIRIAAERLLADVVETRQPIRGGEAFRLLKEKIPLLTFSDFQRTLLHLHSSGTIRIDDQLRLVSPD